MAKIIIIDDERGIRNTLREILADEGHEVDVAENGKQGLEMAQAKAYDLIFSDIKMPEMDGMEVLKKIREKGLSTPVLFLTAKTEVDDRIKGLDLGADDYLPKPFDMGELLARVRAMLRRKEDFAPANLTCGNLTLDRAGYDLCTEGHDKIHLSGREFQMMEMLMTSPGRIISVDNFMDRIWSDGEADINVVWVYISNLRKKLTSLDATCEIKASRGVGYSINEIS